MNTHAFAWPEPAPSLARAVGDDFLLQREIGRGGMGVVYLAEDTQLHRQVAIKTLPPHLAADQAVRERFLREARTAAALSHPNIVPIYSAAERDAVVYFTMGYVKGVSLAERLAQTGPLGGAGGATRKAPGRPHPVGAGPAGIAGRIRRGPVPQPPATPGTAIGTAARLSSTEADAVWARAAELQANTGMMVPPAQFPASPPAASPTRGYDVTMVKDAASEAGIAPRYVERALAEREVANALAQVTVVPGPRMQKPRNAWLGEYTKIEYESVLDGEISLEAFEELADIARRSLGDLIAVNAVGRTLTINVNSARQAQQGMVRLLQVTVAVRNGRTTVRAYEDIAGVAGGLYGAIGAGIGVATGGVAAAMASKSMGSLVGVGIWLGILAGTLGGARVAFQYSSRSKQQELRDLVLVLARFASASLAHPERATPPEPRDPSASR